MKTYQIVWVQNRKELIWFGLIAFLGIITRLVFNLVFPPQPVSDFLSILDFARKFTHDIFATAAPHWKLLNPGTSFFLAPFLQLYPASPEVVARSLTAVLTGLLPLIPFLVWKGVFSLRARVFTALLLALYPAQIIFSGVVAQDNWVLLPTAALGALAVRVAALKSPGRPVWAAVLFVTAFFIRQEMLAALLPVYLVVMAGCQKSQYIKNIATGVLTTALLLGLLVTQRGMATGRFSLTTSHFGHSILGAYAPGAEMSWLDPGIFVAARAPDLFENNRYKEQVFNLILNELRLRPVYHMVRILFSPFLHLKSMEYHVAYWGLTAPGVLAAERQQAASIFVNQILPKLAYFSDIVHIIFLAALALVLFERKYFYTLAPLAAIILKLGLHAVIVSQPRYYFTVYVLEVLVVGSLLDELVSRLSLPNPFTNHSLKTFIRQSTYTYLIIGATVWFGISQAASYVHHYIIRADENTQPIYQFPASLPAAEIRCTVTEGRLRYFQPGSQSQPARVLLDFLKADPDPGSRVVLTCKMSVQAAQTILMRIQDNYPNGDLPNRIIQIVTINGREVYQHDLAAEPGAGWHDLPLDGSPDGTPLDIQVTLLAQNPDSGWTWGRAALTEVQFTQSQPGK